MIVVFAVRLELSIVVYILHPLIAVLLYSKPVQSGFIEHSPEHSIEFVVKDDVTFDEASVFEFAC